MTRILPYRSSNDSFVQRRAHASSDEKLIPRNQGGIRHAKNHVRQTMFDILLLFLADCIHSSSLYYTYMQSEFLYNKL
jgi:hypothetical protein